MTMRNLLPFLALAALAACSEPDRQPTAPASPVAPTATVPAPLQPPVQPEPGQVVLHSLAGSGLKFNGVYDSHASGDLHYFMRFFERGNVVLIAGRQRPDDPVDLRSFLTEKAQSGKNNLHNVPVELRNDSLFFSTMATRGAILYSGKVLGDTLRFFKHSKATGKKAVVDYVFVPDGK
jgi:hypothetical protein